MMLITESLPRNLYLTGAERLNVAVERCIVIEDAPAGITAGKKAGMQVIGITTTHSREELLEKGADIVINRLCELKIDKTATSRCLSINLY